MVATGRLTREGTALRKLALSYPEATEHMPWGHHAIKVKGKSFLFLAADAETFSLSAKLPSVRGRREAAVSPRPQAPGGAARSGPPARSPANNPAPRPFCLLNAARRSFS